MDIEQYTYKYYDVTKDKAYIRVISNYKIFDNFLNSYNDMSDIYFYEI